MSRPVRVRFAPSPTGPLHIGGVRTALYNYLFAKHYQGTFILRVEDTDQNRYVPGAEDYIRESLEWIGLQTDEGPASGGDFGPYRQSERKDLYGQYTQQLLDAGHAYYAFDTPEALSQARETAEAQKETFKYDWKSRKSMRNSLSLDPTEVEKLLADGTPHVVRLKVMPEQDVIFNDLVRGEVKYNSSELDDKVLLKADGMPTYHMANVVDDYLMQISHVIRGEEWLPSTPTHVLLYQGLGWIDVMPRFCHVPLLLKPTGKGKLSKRDGAKFGMPVFPLDWTDPKTGEAIDGFRERGFEPDAVVNFLSLLGWSPGDDTEMMDLEELVRRFDGQRIQKGGARFDFDKAKWFNQQYLLKADPEDLLPRVQALLSEKGHERDADFVRSYIALFQERVLLFSDFYDQGAYFFGAVAAYEEKMLRKKWKAEKRPHFDQLLSDLKSMTAFDATSLETQIKGFLEANELGFGAIFPILRIALTGSTKGPSVFDMMALMGQEMVTNRLAKAYNDFDKLLEIA
ncbi:MAG: glutamate--tRNA ligase [Bacteroidota bacterium]